MLYPVTIYRFYCFCSLSVSGIITSNSKITFARMLSIVSLNLLGALALRMMYRYAYKCGNRETTKGKILSALLHMFSGIEAENEKKFRKSKLQLLVQDVLV